MHEAAAYKRPIEEARGSGGFPRSRALVAEDEPTTRLLISEALEQAGFVVYQAENGQEALELLSEVRPQIVLTDVLMPKLDGFDFCAALRAQPEYEYLPVLMMTGLNDHASVHAAYQFGATDFITKPINYPLLGRRVRYLLRSSEAIQRATSSERRLTAAQRIARLGQWETQPGDDSLLVSGELCRILGFEAETERLSVRALIARVHEADSVRVRAWFAEIKRGATQPAITHRIVAPNRKQRWVRQQVEILRNGAQNRLTLSGTLQDITELRLAEERIRQLAFVDGLTGLPNRTLFQDRFSQAIALAKRHRRKSALLFLDLDDFKRINDTLGHAVGDELLKAIAKRLIASLRAGDSVSRGSSSVNHPVAHMARIGGDEFTVLLPEIRQSSDAAAIARRIMNAFSKPVTLAGREIVVSSSIGIALFPDNGDEPETLLKHADAAMYFAKRQGKNRYRFFDVSLNEEALKRLAMEGELRRILEQDGLSVEYQPQLDLKAERVCGLEALARWESPVLGSVSPRDFIPIAEQTGLIGPIGERIIRTACTQARQWQQAGLQVPRLAVNISPVQFVQSGFTHFISQVLEETGIAPETLELEVTEGLLMADPEHLVEPLTQLKKIGVQLAIDDFGTGYSSLSRLRQFPIDRIKIDRSFIRDAPTRSDDAAIVMAVIAMAERMGIKVIAEGVETDEQMQFLKAEGCDEIQGYYLSQPLRPPEIASLLRDAPIRGN